MKKMTPFFQLVSSTLSLSFSKEYRLLYLSLGILSLLNAFVVLKVPQQFMWQMFLIELLLGAWYFVFVIKTNLSTLQGQPQSISSLLSSSWKSIGRFYLFSFLTGIIVVLGLILLIIPGIIFMIWFAFSGIIVIDGNAQLNPIKQSKMLVSGYFWPVFWRFFAYALVFNLLPNALLQRIGPTAQIFWSITMPYTSLLFTSIYIDLKRVKNNS